MKNPNAFFIEFLIVSLGCCAIGSELGWLVGVGVWLIIGAMYRPGK